MTSRIYPNSGYWSLRSLLLIVVAVITFYGCETSATNNDKPIDWKISYLRSGGLAGTSEKLMLNSQGQAQFTNLRTATKINGNIPFEDLNELTELVKNLPSESKSALGDNGCRDCFTHELLIVVNEKSYTTRISGLLDPNAPESQLLSKLNRLKTTLFKPATTKK